MSSDSIQKGLNVVLGKEDGANSIGKSSAMLAIDFLFGGDTYLKSDGVKHIRHHTIFFAFQFCGQKYCFARATEDADNAFLCKENHDLMGPYRMKDEFVNWLKVQYHMDFDGLSFRIALSSFFRIYGKDNTDERRPLRGILRQDMENPLPCWLLCLTEIKTSKYNVRTLPRKRRNSMSLKKL